MPFFTSLYRSYLCLQRVFDVDVGLLHGNLPAKDVLQTHTAQEHKFGVCPAFLGNNVMTFGFLKKEKYLFHK